MYDQGQYSTNLYHQTDDEDHPIMNLNQQPIRSFIPTNVDFNPYTCVQISHSEWTHEPQEKVWQQEWQNLAIDSKRVVYDPFMIRRPFYIEPVTERAGLTYMGGLLDSAQGGASLYSKDLGAARAIRSSPVFVNRPLAAGIAMNAGSDSTLRVQDFAWGLASCMDYNPDEFLRLYQVYRSQPLTSAHIPEILSKVSSYITSPILKNWLRRSLQPDYRGRLNVKGPMGRGAVFKAFGEQMYATPALTHIQQCTRQDLFFFWIFMPHASAPDEADSNYDKVMIMISNFVLTGSMPQPGQMKDGNGFINGAYTGGENPVAGGISNAVGYGVGQLTKNLTGNNAVAQMAAHWTAAFTADVLKNGPTAAMSNIRTQLSDRIDLANAIISNTLGE